jgi:hypothetical protein
MVETTSNPSSSLQIAYTGQIACVVLIGEVIFLPALKSTLTSSIISVVIEAILKVVVKEGGNKER